MDETQQGQAPDGLFPPDWIKAGADLWTSLLKMVPPPTRTAAGASDQKPPRNRSLESLETALKMWQSLSATMSDPAAASAASKSLDALPDLFLKVAEASWDTCFQIQKGNIEKAGKIGRKVEAYHFENLDQEFFKTLKDIYEKELRQFFYIPQLGLTRFYQERMNLLFDKLALLKTTSAEFFSLLNLPFEQTAKVMQQEVEKLAQQGKVPKQAREYYNLWVKILEGHFMTLFKSPEYNQALGEMFHQLSEFIIAKNEVVQDILQLLPVPTHKEVDALYRDLHQLKKRVWELERQLNPD